MNKLYFMNHGHFDVRAMLTFGVSAKSTDNAIGFFGTGFKYAVAIILRLGGSIKVVSNGEVNVFEARKEIIRDQEFNIVYVNDREAGFTTRLGINWEPWMAFRELYCNCKDENGLTSEEYKDYDTVIEVDCYEIQKCFREKEKYFLAGDPAHKGSFCEIFDRPSAFIYYKGVAVKTAPNDALFTYNITRDLTLTEDRTAKYDWEIRGPIAMAIQSMTCRKMLKKAIRSGNHYEAMIGFDNGYTTSQEFISVADDLNHSDIGLCESARMLIKQIESTKGDWPEFALTKVQYMMLEKSIAFLAKIDIDIRRYPIKSVVGLGDGVMGRALDDVIYISEIPFNMGTKQVASTLMEEWMHLKTGAADFDRQMQSWLFDKILSLGENINGEPI